MPRQEQGKESIRKIQKTGYKGKSYLVTLPIELVEELGWRKGQKVVIKPKGRGLLITDWK